MKTKVAVATVQGKTYFLIVNKLKEKNIPFISLVPGETVPTEVKVVITTEKEKHRINHQKVLVYASETEPNALTNEIMKILQGKEAYEKIVIGVDPGDVFGFAVVADGKVSETANCFSIHDTLTKIIGVVKSVNGASTAVIVRIGNGVPTYKDLLKAVDAVLPPEAVLEVVSEAGTSHILNENKHRRGLRDIASAIRIAGRTGYVYPRKKTSKK